MTEPFRPALLLSMPQLQDPNFAKTVVLLCEYNPDGAFGVVLNRPTDMSAISMVRLDPPVTNGNEMPLYIGGPVEPQRGWILLGEEPRHGIQDHQRRAVSVHIANAPSSRARDPSGAARTGVGRLRRLGTGQLDEELAQSAWLMSDIELDLIFDIRASAMWETAIRRLGADPSTLTMGHGVH